MINSNYLRSQKLRGSSQQKRRGNSIISSAWPNQTYSPLLSYLLIVCGYKISANRRAVSLSAFASFQYTTTTNYTNDGALLSNTVKNNPEISVIWKVSKFFFKKWLDLSNAHNLTPASQAARWIKKKLDNF